ncbi:hypothetical protein ILUMI_04787 [Ignelater luminosus]|uniref:PiggyBac transposable element-derived protein domain-containing protein n=1 Tax=Ignelater luminosus TaxID=2038154 RepID=A0A8K0DBU5_IGNLU|nr:hypothetical protein ILUMI_04787 [Ignelater luminosus]
MWVHANDSGFILQFQIYTGKTRDNVEHNLGERVVTDLTRSLLQASLQRDGIYACEARRSWSSLSNRWIISQCSPQDVELVSRKLKEGSREQFNTIKLVTDYNANMGFVDKSDMYKACYEIDRKPKKWWYRIFWHFIDLTVVNAFIIFKKTTANTDRYLSLKEFRLAVANGLNGADPETPQRGRKSIEKPVKKFKI